MANPDRATAVADIYRLVRAAVVQKRPIEALYRGHLRLLCPHRLGKNQRGEPRVLCYQYGGDSESGLEPDGSPANWRCMAVDKLSHVELLEGTWHAAPNHSRPQTCVVELDVDVEDQRVSDHETGREDAVRGGSGQG
jgi:hypothetical protein